jgi:type III secretion protein V
MNDKMLYLQRFQRLILLGTRYNDIVLAFLVVAVIGLMILPMPTPLVDMLLAVNLGIAVTLLIFSMYIPSALAFSTFPSVLLFTTLFRLSLNITTTRLILLNADAGDIILTFGNFVVAGNFIVGAVVFVVITIVQFLVIAKGSERVAEVAARFTLDAMPGKQMSIDADMRAGLIDIQEARRRRAGVENESQLYGAMDGAMKFVKGDAIAGLIVTAVNIIGGISIGILQKGMPAEKALQVYSILTIGDGLVSQIPALFISVTAGVIVTRVTSEDSGNLGGDIGGQILTRPKALVLGGLVILSFSLIPGFPKIQFLVLGFIVFSIGFALRHLETHPPEKLEDTLAGLAPAGRKAAVSKASDIDTFSMTLPLMVDAAEDVQGMIEPGLLNNEIIQIRRALYLDLGVPFPGIQLRFSSGLPSETYEILLHEVPVSQGHLRRNHLLVQTPESDLELRKIPFETEKQFLPNLPAIWVSNAYRSHLDKSATSYMEPVRIITYHLSMILKKFAGEFIGMQETRYLLEQMEPRYPELVKECQRVLPIQKIAEILQRLVSEEISIRNLRTIFQALIEWGQKEKDVILLTEYVRMSLKRYISHKFSGGQNVLAVYLFDPAVEDVLRKAIRQTSAGSYLALEPQKNQEILEAIKNEIGTIEPFQSLPVLVTSMDIRRYVKKMIEMDFPEIPVLSIQELNQDVITLQPLGRIHVPSLD